jgi:hypothetical protein
VRNSLHQLADFRFQKPIRNDQRFERVAHVTTARRNRFFDGRFKSIDIGLGIGRDALRHARFRVDWTLGMFSFCSRAVKGTGPFPSREMVSGPF